MTDISGLCSWQPLVFFSLWISRALTFHLALHLGVCLVQSPAFGGCRSDPDQPTQPPSSGPQRQCKGSSAHVEGTLPVHHAATFMPGWTGFDGVNSKPLLPAQLS